ncbi:hypothetical protein RCH06_001839 [Polaromonas sp. CG_9.5]|uniref:hypothetical protein n=1 Tax=Polaromonas sp. CG_9.5 TaxID=3071705 RepID=UPI002DF83550|nr:hypothetical protein [Polaromonas sp. CG_9.5]
MVNWCEGVVMADWNYAEWAERCGREHLRGRLATGDFLMGQANTLLSLVLIAVAGLLSYGVRIFAGGAGPVEWGCALAAAWLCGMAAILTAKCIVTRETQTLFNEPAHIYKPDLALSQTQVLAFEMENLQIQINKTKIRNLQVSAWLDRCRYGVIATPLVFSAAALVAGR